MNLVNVRPMRRLRTFFGAVGVLSLLEKRRQDPRYLWLRSLFAIHDIDDLVKLDVPWWTLRSSRMVAAMLERRPWARVFEYGAGASTVWLAKRAREVRYVEHDRGWNAVVEGHVRGFENVAGRCEVPPALTDPESKYRSTYMGSTKIDFERYVRAIEHEDEPFDIITIDGRCRAACLEAAMPKLKPDGIIVFDNSNRAVYRAAIERTGWPTIVTRGLTPCLPYAAETTIMSRSEAELAQLRSVR